MDTHVDNPIQRAILTPKQPKNTGAHLQQPNSEAHEADDSWRDDSCLHTQLRATQPTSHSRAQMSVQPSEFAPAPSMPISSIA